MKRSIQHYKSAMKEKDVYNPNGIVLLYWQTSARLKLLLYSESRRLCCRRYSFIWAVLLCLTYVVAKTTNSMNVSLSFSPDCGTSSGLSLPSYLKSHLNLNIRSIRMPAKLSSLIITSNNQIHGRNTCLRRQRYQPYKRKKSSQRWVLGMEWVREILRDQTREEGLIY